MILNPVMHDCEWSLVINGNDSDTKCTMKCTICGLTLQIGKEIPREAKIWFKQKYMKALRLGV